MKKKVGKTFYDAEKRLRETEAAYKRARKAYLHWIKKLTGKVQDVELFKQPRKKR